MKLQKNELNLIKDNEKEIEDRFLKELEFGTASLRGIIGIDPDCDRVGAAVKASK